MGLAVYRFRPLQGDKVGENGEERGGYLLFGLLFFFGLAERPKRKYNEKETIKCNDFYSG